MHFALGAIMVTGAALVLVRGRRVQERVLQMSQATTPRAMAAAAPQLPGQLQNVDHFRPFRSAMLGFGMFALNPLGVSFAITAALGIVLADLAGSAELDRRVDLRAALVRQRDPADRRGPVHRGNRPHRAASDPWMGVGTLTAT